MKIDCTFWKFYDISWKILWKFWSFLNSSEFLGSFLNFLHVLLTLRSSQNFPRTSLNFMNGIFGSLLNFLKAYTTVWMFFDLLGNTLTFSEIFPNFPVKLPQSSLNFSQSTRAFRKFLWTSLKALSFLEFPCASRKFSNLIKCSMNFS